MQSFFSTQTGRFLYFSVIAGILVSIFAIYQFVSQDRVEAQGTTYSSIDPTKELEDKVKTLFDEMISSSSTTKAFDDWLVANLSVSISGSQSIDDMKIQLADIKKKFGEYRGYDRIAVKTYGDDLVMVYYLLKCDYHPVVWSFTFYRRPIAAGAVSTAPNPWHLIGLRFDTNLELLTLTK